MQTLAFFGPFSQGSFQPVAIRMGRVFRMGSSCHLLTCPLLLKAKHICQAGMNPMGKGGDNCILTGRDFTFCLKETVLKPLLKKTAFDSDVLTNDKSTIVG